MLAIQKSADAVKNLLDDGISPNLRGRESFQGYTPLIFASEIGSLETVKLLIERGARINDSDSEASESESLILAPRSICLLYTSPSPRDS